MPLFYQLNINSTRLALWHITENEEFFLEQVSLHRHITHPQKRLQHLAGRYLLPNLFSDFPKNEIAVADTRKPFLPGEQYHFSISHCGAYAAAIASPRHRVGIDAEIMTPRLENIKRKFLHPEEIAFVDTHLSGNRLKVLSVLWSAKEAMYKWYGLGEVQFSEMMRVDPFKLADEGTLDAVFIKSDCQQRLDVHYRILNDLCLVWVIT